MSFLTDDQKKLATEIAEALIERGQTVCIAEATTGGLISAALLWVAGASRYYAGGGVLYTLNSRIALAGVSPALFENYSGTTVEIITAVADATLERLGATWCLAESGISGPTTGRSGLAPGHTFVAIAGPTSISEVINTELNDREANMVEFTTRSLRLLRDVISASPKTASSA